MNPLPGGIQPPPNSQTPTASSTPVSMPPMGTQVVAAPSSGATGVPTVVNSDLVFSTIGDQCGADAGVKILVYGGAGMGKTVLCATLPMPFVMVSTENGLLSLSVKNLTKIFIGLGLSEADAAARASAVRQQKVIIVRNGIQLKKAREWLTSHMNEFVAVAWDSASETAEVMLEASKAVKADGRQAYGEVADAIGVNFKAFRDSLPGKHVCVVAKEGSVKDEVSGKIKSGPDFPGKQLGPASPYWLDETFRIDSATDANTQTTFRFLQTQPNESYTAKDRSGLLEMYERPDLAYLIDKITTAAV
jgi:hypothetical protein